MIFHLTLSILYAVGIGNLVCLGIERLNPGIRSDPGAEGNEPHPTDAVRGLSTRLGLGILIHALAVMVGTPLRVAIPGGAALALAGLIGAAWRVRGRLARGKFPLASLGWIAVGLMILVVFSTLLPMDVLWKNDARSVWFFHAKIIHFAGALRADSGWAEPGIVFSHPHYPKLLPILAASEGWRLGYWNEFLPKLALAPPLSCYVFALLAGTRGRATLGLVGVTILALLATGGLLHDGYADAYVALPAAGALMATVRYLRSADRQDGEHALVLLGLAVASKEEGSLFLAAMLAGILPILVTKEGRTKFKILLRAKSTWAIAVLSFAPALVWAARAKSFGVQSYLKLDHATFERITLRLKSGAIGPIVNHLLSPQSRWHSVATTAFINLLLAALAVKLIAVLISRRLHATSFLCLVIGGAYFVALCFVYLMTPYDYSWQLGASADRVMLITLLCILVFLADALEDLVPREIE